MTQSTDLQAVIDTFIEAGVLSFGEFTLKSGRVSPYFFNLGKIFQGKPLNFMAKAYASLLKRDFADADVVFGPAYKGIPLASAAAVSAYEHFDMSVGVAFDRKEAKTHGEGGLFVGHPLKGKIVLIDDVITAGSAVRSSLEKMKSESTEGQVVGLIVAMDRQEAVVEGGQSAIQSLEAETGLKVSALLTFADIISYIKNNPEFSHHLPAIEAYRERYGAKA